MLAEQPDNPSVLRLAAVIELSDGKPKIAERFGRQLLEMNAEDDDALVLMAKIKLDQRNYDAAINYADQALEIDAQNTEALNLKIYVGGFLGRSDTEETINEALNVNPEDSSTIANHGYQLLRQGKVDEALDRLKYALSINPNDQLGRYAMLEALKARFWPYRMYFKYKEAMAKLSGGANFGIMIGLWFGVNYLNRLASQQPDLAPFLMPLVYFMVALFLLTWIIDPIMNFYLLTNQYGRLLLDKEDKLMASLVGGIARASGPLPPWLFADWRRTVARPGLRLPRTHHSVGQLPPAPSGKSKRPSSPSTPSASRWRVLAAC